MVTNADDCLNFKLVTAPVQAPGLAHWRDLLPHRANVTLRDADVFAGRCLVHLHDDEVASCASSSGAALTLTLRPQGLPGFELVTLPADPAAAPTVQPIALPEVRLGLWHRFRRSSQQ